MPQNSVKVTLILRHDTAAEWASKNPILAEGEIGAEIDTGLLKMGDGVNRYSELDYINGSSSGGKDGDGVLITTVSNKLTIANYGRSYWQYDDESGRDLEIFESDITKWPSTIMLTIDKGVAKWVKSPISYNASQGIISGANVILAQDPGPESSPLAAVTKNYVDTTIQQAIVNAPHLKRQIVTELPNSGSLQENVIYMLKDITSTGDDKYKEYLVINNELVQIGDTSPDLSDYLQAPSNYTQGHSLALNSEGELIDSGYSAQPPALVVATFSTLGGVKSSNSPNEIKVDQDGYMSLNSVATDLLYVPTGSVFVINGGNATA